MIKQWREIGETDWMDCNTASWFEYCQLSPEHDTRTVWSSAAEFLLFVQAVEGEEI
jgi:hypothetical protein